MIRSKTLRSAGLFVWIVLVAGVAAAVYSGRAESVVTVDALGGPAVVGGGAVGAVVLGMTVYLHLNHRDWMSTGRNLGLSPVEGGLVPLGSPDLEGTQAGRPVRMRRITRKVNSGGESGSRKKTFTVVETDLQRSTDVGVLVGRVPPGAPETGEFDFGSLSIRGETVDDRFVTTSNDEAVANALLTEPVRKALLVLDDVDKFLVGDASSVLMDAAGATDDSFLGGMMQSAMDYTFEGDAGTVTHEIDGTVFDAEELERQLRAVVMAAESFEAATAEEPAA